jgi:hypothetical protein
MSAVMRRAFYLLVCVAMLLAQASPTCIGAVRGPFMMMTLQATFGGSCDSLCKASEGEKYCRAVRFWLSIWIASLRLFVLV